MSAIWALWGFGPVPAADGATYPVYECHGDNSAWADASTTVDAHFGQGEQCAGGGGFGLGIAGSGAATLAPYLAETSWNLTTPTDTYIRAVEFDANLYCVYGNQAYVQANRGDGGFDVTWWANDYPNQHACGVAYACPNSGNAPGPGDWCHHQASGLTSTRFHSTVYCYTAGGCYASPEAHAYIRRLHFTLEDVGNPEPPTIGGSLAEGGPRRGTESLTVSASDAGSGVAALDVFVNGVTVESHAVACDVISSGARRFRPCPATTSVTSSERTDSSPWREGDNSLRVCAADYSFPPGAGNLACSETVVRIDNSCEDSVGSAVGSRLDAGLARANETPKVNAVVGSRDSVTIKGSVKSVSGSPVAGANICVYEQVDARGEDRALADIVHTKNNGTYTSRVDAGPSRNIYVDYRHSNLLLEKQLKLDATTSPTLRVRKRHLHNGQSMRFKGEIPGPFNAGRVVAIQARVGRIWRTFKQVGTDAAGQFKGRYRFKYSTLPRVTYKFRALVAEQDGYPFKAGASKTTKVIVNG